MNSKIFALSIVVLMLGAATVACFGADNSDASTPVEVVTNVNDSPTPITQTYTKVPERVIVGNVTCLEMLLYFGLGDKIVGIYYNEDELWSELETEYNKVAERLGTDYNLVGLMTQAVATELEPDLIMGYKSSFGDSAWAIGTTAYWNEQGCNVWSLNTQASSTSRNIAGMIQDYTDLGNIFNIRDKTDKYIADFNAAIEEVSASGVKVAVMEYRGGDADAYTNYGTTSFIGNVIETMGADLKYATDKNVPKATLIDSTDLGAVIVVAFGENTPAATVESMLNDRTLVEVPAVVNRDVIGIGLSQTYGGVQALTTAQAIAELINNAATHSSSEPGSDDKGNGNTTLYIGVGAAVVIIALLGAAFFFKK